MAATPSQDRLLKQVFVRSFTAPVSLFLASCSVLLAPGPAWPLGLAALAAEAVYLWTRIRDPRNARECAEQSVRGRWQELICQLERVSSSVDPETASTLSAIVAAQEQLLGAAGEQSGLVPTTQHEMVSLLQHCLSLAEKRTQLLHYLGALRIADTHRQRADLEARIASTPDPVTRDLYSQALQQKQDEIRNYGRLEEAVRRIDGQLVIVRCTFENMLSKVACLHTVEKDAAAGTDRAVAEDLDRLTRGVEALEDSLAEALTLRRAG